MDKFQETVTYYRNGLGRDLSPAEVQALLILFTEERHCPDYPTAAAIVEDLQDEIEDAINSVVI